MTRNTKNYWIDCVLFLTMLVLFATGIVLWGWSKPQVEGGQPQILWGLFEGKDFLGMTKNGGWKQIHIWTSVLVLAPFLLLHLFLHLKWFFKTTWGLFCKGANSAVDKMIGN